jgi:hypothetical protein
MISVSRAAAPITLLREVRRCPLLHSTRAHVLLHISYPYTHFVISLYIALANSTLTFLDREDQRASYISTNMAAMEYI